MHIKHFQQCGTKFFGDCYAFAYSSVPAFYCHYYQNHSQAPVLWGDLYTKKLYLKQIITAVGQSIDQNVPTAVSIANHNLWQPTLLFRLCGVNLQVIWKVYNSILIQKQMSGDFLIIMTYTLTIGTQVQTFPSPHKNFTDNDSTIM